MFYKIFVTVLGLMFSLIIFSMKPEWKNNKATTFKVAHCLVFMLVQSLIISGIFLGIYNIWV